MGGSGTTGHKRTGRPAPALTGDPSADGALLALARLLLDIAVRAPACSPSSDVAPAPSARLRAANDLLDGRDDAMTACAEGCTADGGAR